MKCFVYLALLASVALGVPTESSTHLAEITLSSDTGLAEQRVAAAGHEDYDDCSNCGGQPRGKCYLCGKVSNV